MFLWGFIFDTCTTTHTWRKDLVMKGIMLRHGWQRHGYKFYWKIYCSPFHFLKENLVAWTSKPHFTKSIKVNFLVTRWLLWFTGIWEESGGNLTEESWVLVSLSLKVFYVFSGMSVLLLCLIGLCKWITQNCPSPCLRDSSRSEMMSIQGISVLRTLRKFASSDKY